jgi:uncharacterized RDD family membrane protein YckC
MLNAMQESPHLPYLLLRRLLAFLYDSLLLIAVLFVVTGVAVVLNDNEQLAHPSRFLLFWLVGFCYFSWFWRRDGRTLGLQAWKLHVVADEAPFLSWQQCVSRYVSGSLLFGITYVTIPFRADRKALHDVLSRSGINFIKQ